MSEINMKYEGKYAVRTVDILNPCGGYRLTELKAKKIVTTETETIFYDYYGCVSGCFKNSILLGYVKID